MAPGPSSRYRARRCHRGRDRAARQARLLGRSLAATPHTTMSDSSGVIGASSSNSSSSSSSSSSLKRPQTSPSSANHDESNSIASLVSVVACATLATIAMALLAFAGSNPPKRGTNPTPPRRRDALEILTIYDTVAVWGWVFWHVVNGSLTFGERFLQTGGALVGGALANVPWALVRRIYL